MLEITITRLIEAQAKNNPDAIAVIHENIRVTYRELNQRANQLAQYLQAQGVGVEVMVGIAIERSVDMLTSVLGVLKAGGAYVPLDPQYPQARLAYMLEDTRTPVLLTHEKHLPALPKHNAIVLCLDRDWAQIAQYSSENLTSQTQPHDLAYVIYTSGSTGQPKGVMIEQHAMMSYVQATIAFYGIQAWDRVLQFSSLNFDMSVEEIYPCLCQGGSLMLRTEEVLDSPARFCQKSRDWGVTVWILPTAYWHVFMAELVKGELQLPEKLRLVAIGGERALPERVWQWLHLVGTMPILLNCYGPTETTVVATSCHLSADIILPGREVPIGRPLANTQIYVLDTEMNPVSANVLGELYIGGESVARGYLNQPELTRKKFIPNQFCQQAKARLYKTGDLVQLREDGNLEFVGRIDQQIKIQSFRVELGEIESALITHPQVREAVVAVHEEHDDKRLAAYVVTDPELVNPGTTLYAYLKERLPHYMLPKAFVRMTALPLTPSEKIDRKALPVPDSWHIEASDNFIAPRTDTEQKLAQIWSEVINTNLVGASDDFFMLGGHSLIAAQILSRVHQTFGFEIHFRDLLDNPTLEAFAGVIEQQRQTTQPIETLRVTPASRDQTLPASFAQERVAFIEQLAPSMTAYQFQESLHFIGSLEIALLERSLTEIIHRHEIFRTTFPSQHGKLIQNIHPPFEVKLPVIDLRLMPVEQQQAEVIRLWHEFVQQPFDIEKLPLIRWQIVQLNNTEHELFHVEHHTVHDGWSFNIFLRELLALYRAFSQGEAPPFKESPTQFADYALWQHQWVNTAAAQAQLAYWTRTLHNMPPLLELPYDRPRPPEQQFRGAMERMELPLDLCDTLRAFNALEKVTLFMSMFAAFLVLVHRYSRQDDLCIGSGVANRRMHEIENMIGMVVNNIVLRTDMSGNPTFRALLQQMRQVTLAGYAHEDLPFDKVVEALKPERNLSYNPLFQVMFSFHDAQLPDLKQIPGVEVRLHENVGNQSAKFDLDVVVIPRAEQRLSQTSKASEKSLRTDGITLVWVER
jgi:amino acid adenylation domain-containing protein